MVSYLTTLSSITETVNQYLVHIPVLLTENLLFSNRQESKNVQDASVNLGTACS